MSNTDIDGDTLAEAAPVAYAVTERSGAERSVLAPGASVGRYILLSQLGEGGMGVVYSAYDPELDRKVAVKLVHARRSSKSRRARERMIREARAMAKIADTNVITVFDVGEHGDAIYIAMELIDGETLGRRFSGRPLAERKWREVLELFLAAGDGLAAAHTRGLIHRDFKPDNVMVGTGGRVVVMDFGLAVLDGATRNTSGEELAAREAHADSGALKSASDRLTRAGAVVGTPAYMPPEQFRAQELDERVDQFAFCVALWEALFGHRPYAGSRGVVLVTNAMKGNIEPPPKEHRVPRWLIRVLERGLKGAREERWPDMRALLEALRHGQRSRRRRSIAVAVASPVVLASIVGLAMEIDEHRVVVACEAEADEGMPWPGIAETVEAGMNGSGLAFAEASHVRIVPELDAWSTQWAEAWVEACLAAKIDEELDPVMHHRVEECLRANRASMGDVLEQLGAGNRTLWSHAVEYVGVLGSVTDCRDHERLARMPVPDADIEPGIEQAREKLRRANTLLIAGKNNAGIALALEGLADTKALGWGPGIAFAQCRTGEHLITMGRLDEAETMLREAYFRAGGLKLDDVAAQAARMLAGLPAAASREGGETIDWGRHALMLTERLGDEDGMAGAELAESLAVNAFARDDLDEAQRWMQQTHDIRLELLGPGHPSVMVAEMGLGTVMAARGDTEGARKIYESTIDELEAALGPDHPLVGSTCSNLAMLLDPQAESARIRQLLERAETILVGALGAAHPDVAVVREMLAELDAQ
ncbi:MAG: serine/threonine-protein kinase [Myxococcota bacterium]